MIVRVARAEDAEAIAAIYAPHVTGGVASFEEQAPDAAAMRARIAKLEGRFPWLVAEDEGRLLGYAYADRFRDRTAYRWAVETTVYIAAGAQRRGVGRLLYARLLDILRGQGFTQVIAAISLPNDASVKLHELAGFRRAGVYRQVGWKLGRWVDVGLWQAELQAPGHPPAEPRAFREDAESN
ncbi:arsinothricin resistance N-acetyltransferase ArsN1 family B [Sphingomonas sp.]|uniref:arsinothricin resistance N-acetyltransferase ArsN1 family B n=1 Tax=Sphingomonas sp. TaxID=28214 RepID=UPI002DB8F169|nr:arsinothricin resistance N-acetyltransferase ArsN1 family B [Sphingomonas sp.]HEU4969202.1 arsinothricin resistance N-acetyltransferase ArsN1 family B [Sphingomonas sp.]